MLFTNNMNPKIILNIVKVVFNPINDRSEEIGFGGSIKKKYVNSKVERSGLTLGMGRNVSWMMRRSCFFF